MDQPTELSLVTTYRADSTGTPAEDGDYLALGLYPSGGAEPGQAAITPGIVKAILDDRRPDGTHPAATTGQFAISTGQHEYVWPAETGDVAGLLARIGDVWGQVEASFTVPVVTDLSVGPVDTSGEPNETGPDCAVVGVTMTGSFLTFPMRPARMHALGTALFDEAASWERDGITRRMFDFGGFVADKTPNQLRQFAAGLLTVASRLT